MKLLWTCILLHLPLIAYTQQSDSIFQNAKNAAYHQRYDESKKLLQGLIELNPRNADYIKLKANVFAWNKEYDSALAIIKTVPSFSSDLEAQLLFSTFLFWNQEFEMALSYIENIISANTSKVEPKLLELDILFALKKYHLCYKKALKLSSHPKAKRIAHSCEEFIFNKNITISYQGQRNENSVVHLTSISIAQSYKKFTIGIAANQVMRQNKIGSNYQLEVYKKWGKLGYTYVSSTVSKSNLFPLYSSSVVHFLPTFKRIESDWGIRVYNSNSGYKSLVPSIGISYSFNQLNINYRFYKIISSLSSGVSHSISVSKYFKQPAHSIRLEVGVGNQFDRTLNLNNEIAISRSGQSIGITYTRPVGSHIRVRVNLTEQQQRINDSFTSHLMLGTLSFTYRFTTAR